MGAKRGERGRRARPTGNVPFFDGIFSERLPANVLPVQRELIRSHSTRSPSRFFIFGESPFVAVLTAQVFGARTHERVDKPRGEFCHSNWTGTDGRVASSPYTV